ncbi:hypothetical protein XELAEV_180426541mg, partial [Xenopus laevis]
MDLYGLLGVEPDATGKQ